MRKLVRITAAALGGLLALIAIGVLAAAWLVDVNDYKRTLAREFERRTGRTLAIEDELALDYVPWLAAETGGIVVGNAPGHSERAFARIERLAARIELLPLLLERRVRLGTIVLEGLELNLEIDAEGRGNWLLRGGGAAPGAPRADAEAPAAPGWLATLGVEGLEIRDATVTWRDLAASRTWSVTGLSVTTGAYTPGTPVDVEAAFRYADAAAGVDADVEAQASVDYAPGAGLTVGRGRAAFDVALSERAALEGVWRFDAIEWPAQRTLTVTAAELTGTLATPALGPRPRQVALAAPRIEIDASAGRVDAARLTTSADGLEARWRLTTAALGTPDARIDGRVELEPATLATTLDVLGVTPPASVDAAAAGTFRLASDFALRLDPLSVELTQAEASVLGTTFEGHAEIATPGGKLKARGALATPGIAPQALEAAFGTLLTDALDPRELGTLAFDTRFDYDAAASRLTFEPFALEILGVEGTGRLDVNAASGAPVLTGRARVAAFEPRALMRRFGRTPPNTADPDALASASVETRFELTPERVDFRELVLEVDDSRITGDFSVTELDDPAYAFDLAIDTLDADRYLPPPAEDTDAGERAAGDLELRREALDALRLEGRVTVGELRLAGLGFERVATRITLGRGRLALEDAGAALYGGRFDGRFAVDASGETPRMSLAGRAERVDVAPLIEALRGDALLSGTGDFDLSLEGTGATVTDNVRNAAGTLEFTLRDGAVDGFDLGRALCAAYNATQRLPRPREADTARTRFELLGGTADVARGVATSTDLLGRTAFMDVTGHGSLDLAERGLDYALEATLTGPIAIPRCESMQALVGESIPLTLRGTVTAPEIRPDFGEIVKRRIEDALRERATESLEDRVRERLRELF